ncbi:MAG: YggT family protein, partial [Undibacterium sp.]|nr:YggT family protein [Undibacterium sp.]
EAILSFVNPYAPLAPLIRALNAPILAPLRRLIPPVGGLDFSILVAFVILQMLNWVLHPFLPNFLYRY